MRLYSSQHKLSWPQCPPQKRIWGYWLWGRWKERLFCVLVWVSLEADSETRIWDKKLIWEPIPESSSKGADEWDREGRQPVMDALSGQWSLWEPQTVESSGTQHRIHFSESSCKKSEGAREFIYQLLSVIGLGMLPRDTSCRHISEQCHAHWQRGHSRLRQLGAGHPEACMERIPAEKIWFQHQEHLLETRTWVEEKCVK